MCEIFWAVKPNGTLSLVELKKFLNACLPAADDNDDGWGAMWESGFVKRPVKFEDKDIDYVLYRYRKSRFFLFHLRRATSDVNYENTHPFTVGNFRGVHNGVVTVEGYKEGVDSLELLHKIRDTQSDTFGGKIISALSKGITGTYSVVIHSFSNQKLYYFRNRPNFGFMLVPQPYPMIYGATDISRLESLSELSFGIFPDVRLAVPQPKKVYEIDLNTGMFTIVGEITEEEKPIKIWYAEKKQNIDYGNLAPRRGWANYKPLYDSDSIG